eukprot:COSAG02_NODE_42540_length_383_cov_1.271127_2_plen_24_part_01
MTGCTPRWGVRVPRRGGRRVGGGV